MKFEILCGKDINENLFKDFYSLLEESLLRKEYRSFDKQKKLLGNKLYKILFCFDDNVLIGAMVFWNLKDFVFVEHFAVRENFRNKGIGSKMMKFLLGQIKNNVILEVELPYNEMNNKRILFYERLGFHYNDFEYYQIALNEGDEPLPLRIMSYPESISKEYFEFVKDKLTKKVYSC